MAALADPILRGLLFVFLVICLGLTGALIESADHTNPQVNFGIFAAVFGLVTACFYGLAAAFVEALAFPIVLAVLDFLNFVFLFTAPTAIAVATRTHSCSNQDYLDSNKVAQGSSQRCREAQAVTAFFYFAFFVQLALLVYSVLNVVQNGAFSIPSRRRAQPPRTGIPTMSQV